MMICCNYFHWKYILCPICFQLFISIALLPKELVFCSVHIVLKQSFQLREEQRHRVLRKIFGPNMDVTREWQRLHN